MSDRIDSFRSIILLWCSHKALARDIGVPVSAVRKWAQRDRIPAERWSAILRTKPAVEAGLSAEKLSSLLERRCA